MYSERLLQRRNKTVLERDYHFFTAFLLDMDLGNVDTTEV